MSDPPKLIFTTDNKILVDTLKIMVRKILRAILDPNVMRTQQVNLARNQNIENEFRRKYFDQTKIHNAEH